MEALQSYLFDNCQEFQEGHYINLMALLLKAYQEIPQPQVIFVNQNNSNQVSYIDRQIAHYTSVYNTSRTININIDTFNELKNNIDIEYPDIFVNKLKELHNIDPWESTRFIFPSFIESTIRQKIHIIGSYENFGTYTIKHLIESNGYLNNLNLFIS